MSSHSYFWVAGIFNKNIRLPYINIEYLTRDAKAQKPLNVSLGIPNSLAMSAVHQCDMSDMMQLGDGCC